MSTDAGADRAQNKQREFMQLLPLTTAIAGLPEAEHGKYYNEGQLEVRANALKQAFKYARQLVIDVAKP
ncbi:MAG TPA: hypothetical protein VH120_08055 [Gemmataceae bacterium]|jgi:hypothetical protein|nr:hypothetical protein [Gemmataceae bacterium]